MWTYHIVDTVSGVPLFQVFPTAGGAWGRMISDQGLGNHSFPLGGNELTREQWLDATSQWSRTLVVSYRGTAKYAGLILKRDANRQKRTWDVRHKDLRVILGRRFFHDINGYRPDLVLENLNMTIRSLAGESVRKALVTAGGEQWKLPVVIPDPVPGTLSRKYYAYEFVTAENMLNEIESVDNGPDIDFEPRWNAAGNLEWLMRIGSPRLEDVPQFEFPVNVPEPAVIDLQQEDDGAEMLTGLLAAGKGAEMDMRVGKGISVAGPVIPFLDSSKSFKEIDDLGILNSHALGEVRAHRYSTEQWECSIDVESFDRGPELNFARVRLGTIIRLRFQDDPFHVDGFRDLYAIGIYGDGTNKIRFQLQDPGRL